MNISRTTFGKPLLASALAMAGLGLAGQAHAVAVAYSSVQLFEFQVLPQNGATFTPTPNARQTSSNASYPGYPSISNTVGPNLPGGGSDVPQAKSGPGLFPAENTYSPSPVTNAASLTITMAGARGDARTADIVGDTPDRGLLVQNVSEVKLDNISGSTQGGSANTNSGTLGILSLTAPADTLNLSFDALVRRYASTTEAGEYAFASTNVSFTLTPTGGGVATPMQMSGTDYARLTGQCDSSAGEGSLNCDSMVDLSSAGQYFTLTPLTALAVGDYSLSLNIASSANARDVPEPATMSLLGAGLMGLAAARRRKAKVKEQEQVQA
ncbi:EDSAP-1 family PEP-CTERM protein [Malikia sp.]|uniref:EDSAP-1 family PEP-CTERM protein n=1 Tax=Malikia sp. TaxID=2070706 RepID=UPI00263310FB|nr:EDSAP-1 family PEP-CTERM protein [Malikia sp.]MDD2728566.1 PEP-CTERM sorting domain-containing protein [Malikia sp.]